MDAPEEPLPPVIYTMENKPIVTCAGDQNLFTSIYPTLSQQLPREPMEWRRSYGRAPKMIHLESNFVQFKEELLPKEGNKALLTFPFLHIYWTECCDTEVYKATVKDDLTKWQNVLKAHSSVDWLIVVVENDAKKKNKTNILPRTSIVDKIRNDFCNKQSDRCVVLTDPLKDSSRTQESWNTFLTKLRTLLLMSFTKNLGKFEDDMRTLREKRTEPGWSFCEYFMVQEELAFVFEMLQQFEDALVQYDELDALFSQYVVNFGAGDGANWLTFFCQPVKSWNGLILRKPIDMEKRELIQRQEATLLDLRSYLFARQCTLLLFLQRPWEVAQRALELLHSCVQELKLLEVCVPPGALDCWVFLSCLEVLQRIEGCCDRAQIDSNIAHTVGLWSYATEKLKSLGYLCGLVSEKGPDSEDLNRTVDLLAGLGAERPETANTAQSPYKKLKEALSSVEAFEKHYLDLSHATIEMYTSIGRIRSAKLVGKDLAEFYMRKKSPQKAESYLQGALKNYLAEGWALPITHTRKQLAECQKHLGQIENYLQTSSLLAGDRHLTEEERTHFCQEILNFASRQMDSPGCKVVLPMHSFAHLRDLRFTPSNAVVHVGGVLSVEITVCSQMPIPVRVEQITISVHFSIEKNSYRKTAEWLTKHKTSNGIINFPVETLPFPESQNSFPALELYEMFERSPSDNSLNTTGIICKNVHMLLRRQESSAALDSPSGVALEDGAHVLKCSGVTLEPGANTITFRTQAKEPGTYTLRQLCASAGPVCFVLPHLYPLAQYDVYSQEPQLRVEPLADSLLAGIPQKVKFTVTTGHYTVKNGDSLQLSNVEAMLILCHAENRAVIYSNTREKASEASLRVQSSDKVTSISLPAAPAYHMIEFELEVLSLPSAPTAGGESNTLGVTEAQRKHKDTQKAGHCMATTDHKVSIECPWSIYSTVIALTFSMPFRTTHALLSSGTRKYIQICIQNLSELDFHLSDSALADVSGSADLQLLPLNLESQQHICSQQSVFFVWELTWTREPPPSLHARFSVGFRPASQERLTVSLKPYTYEFQVENFFFSNLLGTVYRRGNLNFTCDGNSVISPVGNRVTVFDLKNNKSNTLPLATRYNVKCVGLSPDGRLAIIVDEGGNALLVSLVCRSVLHHFHFKGCVHSVSFSPDGRKFVVTKGNIAQMYHAPGRKREFNAFVLDKTYFGPYDETTHIDWTDDSKCFAVGSKDMSTWVFGAERWDNLIYYALAGHKDAVVACFFESNSLDLYTLSQDGALCVWQCDTPPEGLRLKAPTGWKADLLQREEEEKEEEEGEQETTIRGKATPASEEQKGKVKYSRLAKYFFNKEGDFNNLTAAAYHKKIHLLVTGFASGIFHLHELPEFNLIHSLSISDQRIESVAINSSGDWIALGCSGLGQLLVWEWQSESYVLKQQGHFNSMVSLAYSPDGQYIVTGGDDGKVKVWNTLSGFCFITFTEHSSGVTGVTFTTTGYVIVTSSMDGTVRAFDLHRYRNFRTFTSPRPTQFSCVAVDSSGEIVSAGAQDSFEIFIWSMQTGRLLEVLSGHEGPISGLCFNPMRSVLASASWDRTVRLWDMVDSWKTTETLTLTSDALAVTFRPDGAELAVATLNSHITFWDPENAVQTGSIEGRHDLKTGRKELDKITAKHSAKGKAFTTLCYSADGQSVLAGGMSKFVCIYHVKEQILRKKFEISCNLSLDAMEEFLNRRKMTEFGNLALIDQDAGEENGVAIPLPGVKKGDMSSRHFKPEIRVTSLRFSPTGRCWAATTTEGLLIYSLDTQMLFDPFELDTSITPGRIRAALHQRDFTRAILMALRLNERKLVQEALESVPWAEIEVISSSLPELYVEKVLEFLASSFEESRHLEFYLIWTQKLLMAHGQKLKSRAGKLLPAVQFLQKSIQRHLDDVSKLCDWNRYNLQYALAVSKQRGMKRPSELLGSEEEADGSDGDDSLHLLGGGHEERGDRDRLLV